ncbi:MAG: helix-turn-helix domain-containing protein [Bacteroidales bacterium]|nr:helix-turn-helix domain-containing protein [Bacteroidales bacterium]
MKETIKPNYFTTTSGPHSGETENFLNTQLQLAHQYVEFTNKNVFLTGKAGTGKTTFLHRLKRNSPKRCVVVAPTGVAAINAGGVTIHSFFQMPFGPHLPKETIESNDTPYAAGYTRISKSKIDIIRSLDLLIIDEISMVRADLLDGIDEVLRRYRRTTKPFGGVQLLMIGDIRQLSPVVKEEDWQLLKPYYNSLYFFESHALQKTNYISIELKHIYRQSDERFIEILNKIRENQTDNKTLEELNKSYNPAFLKKQEEGYIILTTHNARAKEINQSRLDILKNKTFTFSAEQTGNFPEYMYPTEAELELKEGAQVMFVKNDPSAEKRFYNGKIGVIEKIAEENNLIFVKCPDENESIAVNPAEWENCMYTLNPETKEIEETVIGVFKQFPLKLAWAITIHKSQGLTFDKAIIDAHDSFAHGQVYVALSRCRSLDGLVLSSPIVESSIKSDTGVSRFSKEIEENQPGEEALKQERNNFRRDLLFELFDFKNIQYRTFTCIKRFNEHAQSILGDQAAVFQEMNNLLETELIKVSEKFQPRLQLLLNGNDVPENQLLLNERIRKAVAYFSEKLDMIVNTNLSRISVETDNRQIKKQLTEALENLNQEFFVKKECLNVCREGFDMKKYLDTRAKASIEKIKIKPAKRADEESDFREITHPELYAKIRKWRNQLASQQGIPPYRIISQKAVASIAINLPASVDELLLIKGIGRKKITTYGTQILELINAYCKDFNIKYQPDFELVFNEKKKKENKPDTKKISLELYRQGKTVEQIAAERGLTVNTIEGHLAHAIENGELGISGFLSEEQVTEITTAIKKSDSLQLTPLKDLLNHKYDYGKLKMAVAHYLYETSMKRK